MNCIITPGHGIITDSLIMHGIIKVYGNKISRVIRVGEKFVICGDFNTPNTSFIELMKEELELAINKTDDKTEINKDIVSSSEYLSKIRDANINKSVLPIWFNSFLDSINVLEEKKEDLSKIYDFKHKEENKEGRKSTKNKRRSTKNKTVYLPLGYIYGKYWVNNKKVEDVSYQVCNHCFAFSNIGLQSGVILINTIVKKENTTDETKTFISLIPDSEISGTDALLLQRFTEGKTITIYDTEMTIPASLLYSLSIGETLYSFNTNISVLVWRLKLSNQFQRALQPLILNINTILDKIALIKATYPYFTKLLEYFISNKDESNKDGMVIMTELARYLIYSTEDVYKVIRDISMFVSKNNLDVGSVKDLAEVLLSFQYSKEFYRGQ